MRKVSIPFYVSTLAGLMLLAACQTTPTRSTGASTAPTGTLPGQPAAGAVHYTVDAAHSDVRFLVYKSGPLAAFGHDHVVQARDFKGDVYLASDLDASSFELVLPVKSFVVDVPAARAEEGADFAKQPSPEAVQGTTVNMLGPQVLDAEKYPEVRIQSVKLSGSAGKTEVTVRITLHGTARDLTLPVAIEQSADGVTASGSFELSQTEFGMRPLSAAGGGLQVADVLRVKFHIRARKTPASGP
jgi:polyisoprenoid-binding protein YceI